MTYEQFLKDLAQRTSLREDDLRSALFCIPDILIQMPVGETVRTPLGTFKMTKRTAKTITPPQAIMAKPQPVNVPEQLTVKLKPGGRLKKV